MVVDAATRAKVKLLAYTRILHADTRKMVLAREHVATENRIRASGLPYALLRNGWHHEYFTETLAPALPHGVVTGASGEGIVHAAARSDYAAAAVAVLLAPVRGSAVHELAGDHGFRRAQLAAAVSRVTGRLVAHKDMPEGAHRGFLQGIGLPAAIAQMLVDSDVQAAGGALADKNGALRGLIGRATTKLDAAVRAGLGAAQAQHHA